jgi:transposase
MAQKNANLFRRKMTTRKFRDLLRLFAVAITADRAVIMTGLHHKTTVALFQLLRWRMAALAREKDPVFRHS